MKYTTHIHWLTTLGIALLISTGQGQNYHWPTNASQRITATFGDMRPRRYHAGIDVATNGGRGYEVYAVEDGYVERLLVSTQGYGRTVYLRLNDKRVAVYAHLERFAPEIDRLVGRRQTQLGRYALELRFKATDLPVRKGDVIAYTGDTGSISGPHLHFELRDQTNRPLNPLTNGFTFPDSLWPEISALAVIPLSPETVAHGSTLPSVIPTRKVGPRSYVLDDTLAVDGPFGLAVEAYDRLPGTRYRQTVYGLSLAIDGIRHYAIQFDRYQFREGRLMALERDYRLYRKQRADFHRLFVSPGSDSLSFIRPGSQGAIELTPGYHPFVIKIWDKQLNVAILRGVLAYTPPTHLEAEAQWSEDESGWIITLDSNVPLRRYDVFFFDIRGRQVDHFSHRTKPSSGKQQRFLVPRSKGRRRILQIIGVDRWGARLEPVHLSLIPIEDVTRQREFTLQIEHGEKGVIFQLSSDYYLPHPPKLLLRTSAGVQPYSTQMVSPVDFLSPPFYLAQLIGLTELIVRVNLDPAYEVHLPVKGVVVPHTERRELNDEEGIFLLEFLPGTFYDSTFVWFNPTKVSLPEGANPVMHPVEVGPYSRPFNNPMGIQMKVPTNRVLPEHAGIFYLDRQKGWELMPPAGTTSRDNLIKTRAYRTLATSGEVYALLEETQPPEIEFNRPGQGGTYAPRDLRTIRFNVTDALAGIRDETAISLTLDGQARIFEYNTLREVVTYVLPAPLEPGDHELIVTATDQLGNTATKSVTFAIE